MASVSPDYHIYDQLSNKWLRDTSKPLLAYLWKYRREFENIKTLWISTILADPITDRGVRVVWQQLNLLDYPA